MIFHTPVWRELQRRQPANTTFPHCRTPSLKADVVWSLSKWKTVGGDSLNVCQGCACICSNETVFWKNYIFGSSCCGTAGELIKLTSRQSTASSSCYLLEPSRPLFLSHFLGLPLQLAWRDPPHQQYRVQTSGPQAPTSAPAGDAVGCSAAVHGADTTARATVLTGARGKAVQVGAGLAQCPSVPAEDSAEDGLATSGLSWGFHRFLSCPLEHPQLWHWEVALDGVSPGSPHRVGRAVAPWQWSIRCQGAGGLWLM